MPFNADELSVVRSWVGPTPTDQDLNDMFDRLGSADAVVSESLRKQYAILLEQPSSISLPSGLSVSVGQNQQFYATWIKKWEASGGTGLDEILTGTARLYRQDRR